jgi:hypothetical protein
LSEAAEKSRRFSYFEATPSTDKVDNLQPVFFGKERQIPCCSGNDLAISFDRHAITL